MRKAIIAGLLALAAGGAILGGLLSGGEKRVVELADLRPARLPTCPTLGTDDRGNPIPDMEKCPAGAIQRDDHCLCLTDVKTGELTNEETVVAVGKRKRMVVCEVVEEKTGKKYLATRYELSSAPLDPSCKLVIDDIKLPGLSLHNVESGIEDALRSACSPCPITSDSWGPCPACIYDNSCAAKCR